MNENARPQRATEIKRATEINSVFLLISVALCGLILWAKKSYKIPWMFWRLKTIAVRIYKTCFIKLFNGYGF